MKRYGTWKKYVEMSVGVQVSVSIVVELGQLVLSWSSVRGGSSPLKRALLLPAYRINHNP